MTFKATVTADGSLPLGDAAGCAGFGPGRVVEIIVTRAGSLILALDDSPPTLDAHFCPVPAPPRRPLALGTPIAMQDIVATAPAPRSDNHGFAIGARMIGISTAEYRRHIEAGEKWCAGHHDWHMATTEIFYARRTKRDGLDNVCKEIVRRQSRERWRRLNERRKGTRDGARRGQEAVS